MERKFLLYFLSSILCFLPETSCRKSLAVADYLKSCGLVNSIKISNCLTKSSKIDKEIRKKMSGKVDDFSSIRNVCSETIKCFQDLNCKPAIENHQKTIDFCWRVEFIDSFKNCEKLLLEVKKTKEGECLKNYKSDNKMDEKELCNFLRKSQECMKKHIREKCMPGQDVKWDKFSRESYAENHCQVLTGMKFDN